MLQGLVSILLSVRKWRVGYFNFLYFSFIDLMLGDGKELIVKFIFKLYLLLESLINALVNINALCDYLFPLTL